MGRTKRREAEGEGVGVRPFEFYRRLLFGPSLDADRHAYFIGGGARAPLFGEERGAADFID